MSLEKFTDFLKGFAAAHQLMNRAGSNGFFVEYVCLATSIIDGLIRVSLILKHQLDTKSCNIPTELIYQSEQCKIITERAIYKSAFEKNILTIDQFKSLKTLYERRNKVIHRYIISEITTDQVLQIANEYQGLIEIISAIVYKLEEQQIKSGVGITVDGPDMLPNDHKMMIQEMANEKHAHPILAKNLNATSADIYKFANNLKKDKVGRNDLCHCGSGKKYKKCCLSKK